MGINYDPDRIDVDNISYESNVIAVTTSAVEAKVGLVRNPNRQIVIIYNDSSNDVFIGPLGVTSSGANKGIRLASRERAQITAGDVGVYLIAASGSRNCIVQELG